MIEPTLSTSGAGERDDRSRWVADRIEKLRAVAPLDDGSRGVDRNRKRTVVALAAAVGLGALLSWIVFASSGRPEPPLVEAGAGSAPGQDLAPPVAAGSQFVLGGWIRARRVVNVGTQVSGLVAELRVSPGSTVTTGQVIAELASDHLAARVEQARATLALRQAALEELRNGALNEEVEIARAAVAEMEADLGKVESLLERQQALAREGLISRQELEDLGRGAEVARQRLRAARERYRLVRRGPRQEQLAQAEALVREAQASLQVAEAQVEQTVIRAPIDGVVVTQHVEVGELVSAGFGGGAAAALVTLADISALAIEVDVPHADRGRIHVGQELTVTSEAAAGRSYRGRVSRISPEANRQKLSVPIEVEVLGDTEGLIPGLSATLRFDRSPGPRPVAPSAIEAPAAGAGSLDPPQPQPETLGGKP